MKRILNKKAQAPTLQPRHFGRDRVGQASIEFSLCVLVAMLMLYGLVKAFIWAGKELPKRPNAHQSTIVHDNLDTNYYSGGIESINAVYK